MVHGLIPSIHLLSRRGRRGFRVFCLKEAHELNTGQNNAEGQVFRAKADQPAFVAWTAGVCCRMTRRINVPH